MTIKKNQIYVIFYGKKALFANLQRLRKLKIFINVIVLINHVRKFCKLLYKFRSKCFDTQGFQKKISMQLYWKKVPVYVATMFYFHFIKPQIT